MPEQYSTPSSRPVPRRTYRLPDGRIPVLVSSDGADLVAAEAAALRDYVGAHPEIAVADIGAHLLRTRPARRHRAVVLAGDRDDLIGALDAVAHGRSHRDVVAGVGPAAPRRVAYTYPGQGSQRPGMGRDLYDISPPFRAAVDECHELSMRIFGTSPRDYLLGDVDVDDPAAIDVRVVQPALFMQMLGLTAMWDDAGARPACTVGHSQGEIAAAWRSGVITMSDALAIVTMRARLVHELAPTGHTMAVLGIDVDECEQLLARHSGWAQLSVINSAHILCISGHRTAVLEMVDSLVAQGKFAKEIRVEYPAHTSIVSEYQPAFLDALGSFLGNTHMMTGDMPFIGATLGGPVDESISLGDYWFWNLRNRVRFDKAIADAATTQRADFFIEMSEHPTLLLAIGETLAGIDGVDPQVLGTSRRDADGLAEFTRNVATLAVSDNAFRWEALATGPASTAPPLAGFPNTVMRRIHLWADREAGMTDPVNSPQWAAAQSGRSVQRLVTRWLPLARRKLLAPRRIALLDPTGRCGDLAASISAAARDQGATATLVDGSALPTDIDTAVLLVGPPGGTPDAAPDVLTQLLADGRWRTGLGELPEQFWWITRGGEQAVDGDPVPDVVHGSITSALRCGGAEFPGTWMRHLDLTTDDDDLGADIVAALHIAAEPELALRAGKLLVKRWVLAEPTQPATEPALDHVLITGGTGKLGLEFCEHYAQAGARRITLVSRSGGTAATAVRLEAVRRRADTRIDVVRCDVGEHADVVALAESLSEPVTLLMHTALNYVAAPLTALTESQVADAVRAKVTGLRQVLAEIPCAPDVSVVLCSSVAATLGGRNQALYALTNRMLDIAAAQLRADGITAGSVQWGLWRVQGPLDDAGVAAVEGAGVVPMAPSAALAAGLADLAGDSVVLAADWPELRDLLGLFGYQSILAEIPDAPSATASPQTSVAVIDTVDAPESTPAAEAAAAPAPSPVSAASIATALRAELAVTMGLDGQVDLDPDLPLVAVGLDSLQALDFRKRVKVNLDADLPVEAILGGASLREVVELMS